MIIPPMPPSMAVCLLAFIGMAVILAVPMIIEMLRKRRGR